MKNLIYGINPLEEALQAGKTFDKIFVQRGQRNERIAALMQQFRDLEIPVQLVPEEKLNRLTSKTHQGIVAFLTEVSFCKTDDVIAQAYAAGEVPLLLLADRITDVRNFGALARTAYIAGVHGIIIPFSGAAALNEDAVKSSSGALTLINLCREKDLVHCIKQLRLNGIQTLAADGLGTDLVEESDWTVPTCLILGSEGEGIEPAVLRLADRIVKLPVVRAFDSYNVSVAAGMMLYECMRQRRKSS